jgi:hypothetical protein
VVPTSDFIFDLSTLKTSPCAKGLLMVAEKPSSMRFIQSVLCNGEEVRGGDCVLLEQKGSETRVGKVSEMAEVCWRGQMYSHVRMVASECRVVHAHTDGSLRADAKESARTMLVEYERMKVTVVTCTLSASGQHYNID